MGGPFDRRGIRPDADARNEMDSANGEREPVLLARIRVGDRRAFDELYAGYRPRLSRFALQLVKRPQLAEEVVNDTMMVVWEGLDRFRGESRFSTWLFGIAYRKGLKALSRNRDALEDRIDETYASTAPSPEDCAVDTRRQAELRRALDRLSADHRTVMDLTYFHEMGYREIATIMDCPVDTVKTRMFHARRHLRKLLAGDQSDWL